MADQQTYATSRLTERGELSVLVRPETDDAIAVLSNGRDVEVYGTRRRGLRARTADRRLRD